MGGIIKDVAAVDELHHAEKELVLAIINEEYYRNNMGTASFANHKVGDFRSLLRVIQTDLKSIWISLFELDMISDPILSSIKKVYKLQKNN